MRRAGFWTSALLTVLCAAPMHAQETTATVRGTVVDSATRQPVAGAQVSVAGRSALSSADGRYVISGVRAGTATVQARRIGYAPATQEVTVLGNATVVADFSLAAEAVGLAEMVVTGYGTQSAGDITGAVANITSADFNTGTIVTPQLLIENKIAGVEVVDNNDPGGGLSIRIRGATSVNASSEPLYVVDGMPIGTGAGGGLSAGRDPLNFINPNDIESITVLKDASAAAIYGANAANGVVIITTKSKSGGAGRGTQVEYSGSFSSASITKAPSMLDAAQFRAAVTQYAPGSVAQLGTASTDWFSLIDRTAMGQEHNLVVASSGQSSGYRLSLGYKNQDGIIKGSNLQLLSLGFNYNQRLFGDRVDLRTSIKGSREMDLFTPGGVLSNAAQMGPTQPVYDPTSTTGYYNWPNNTLTSADNPVEALNLATSQGSTYRSVGNVQADLHIPWVPGLTWSNNLGYDAAKVTSTSFGQSVLHAELKSGDKGYFYRSDQTQVNTVAETYLNYSSPLNVVPGNIDLTGGYSYAFSHAEYPSISESNLSSNLLGINGIPPAANLSTALYVDEYKLISFFARANYNLNDRYLIAASIRRDGSSRFAKSNAWGNFPSVSLAWRISQEPFLRGIKALSDLKIRASWARTGNQAFADYEQYTTFQAGNPQAQYQFGSTFVPTIRPSAVDPNIKWEATASSNIGIDYGFLNQRISGAIDYYVKKTSDLIFTVPVPAGTNLSNYVTTNIGSMQNKGLELSLNARILEARGTGLGWTADFTASTNSNKLTSISANGAYHILVGAVAGGVGTTVQVLQAGQPINSFYVCQQAYASGKPVEGKYYWVGGDSTFQSAPNSDNCDSRGLRTYHSPAPTWILGHTSTFTYRNFDLSFTLRAWLGNYVYNNIASNMGTYQELLRSSPYNLSTDVLRTGFTSPHYLSDYYVQDASFLRMDNLTLGYNFRYRDNLMRLFVAVQNAFTITGYKGVDPTAGLNGIDNNIYPRSRTVTGGLSVQL